MTPYGNTFTASAHSLMVMIVNHLIVRLRLTAKKKTYSEFLKLQLDKHKFDFSAIMFVLPVLLFLSLSELEEIKDLLPSCSLHLLHLKIKFIHE